MVFNGYLLYGACQSRGGFSKFTGMLVILGSAPFYGGELIYLLVVT